MTHAPHTRRRSSIFCVTDSARCNPRSCALIPHHQVTPIIKDNSQPHTIRMAVPSRIHNADSALGTNCEWVSPVMHKINNACTFTIDDVESTSSALITLFTAYRIPSNTLCGNSLRAAATRHIENSNIGGGDAFDKNSACVTTGSIGATSVKYALMSCSMTSRSMRGSTGLGRDSCCSSFAGFWTWISPSPVLLISNL